MTLKVKDEQKNGNAALKAPETKAQIPVPAKHDPKKQESHKVSIEDRIMKVEELRALTNKRQKTLSTLHQLKTFQFASDDSCFLTITDSQGQKFQTGNSNLVNLLRSYLESVLGEKISALDDEILDFSI